MTTHYDENGKLNIEKVEEIEWLLRYGSEEPIIENRYYIASIISKYIELIRKGEDE